MPNTTPSSRQYAALAGPRACTAALAFATLALAACGSGGGDTDAQAPAAGGAAGSGAASGPAGGPTGSGGAAGTSSGLDAATVVQQLNAARSVARSCGGENYAAAAPLRWNDLLEAVAGAHSEWMQANDTLSHTGSGGSSIGTRVSATGYAWRTVGENLAAGYDDVAAVIAGWLASPPHCKNLMNPAFAETGLALERGTSANRYATWWTLVLAQPK